LTLTLSQAIWHFENEHAIFASGMITGDLLNNEMMLYKQTITFFGCVSIIYNMFFHYGSAIIM